MRKNGRSGLSSTLAAGAVASLIAAPAGAQTPQPAVPAPAPADSAAAPQAHPAPPPPAPSTATSPQPNTVNPLSVTPDRQVTGQSQGEMGVARPGETGGQAPLRLGEPQPAPAVGPFPRIEAHADMHNLFILRNDADFDRTSPYYDKNGQSTGAIATVFRPKLTYHINQGLRLYYEAELGLNFWSKNNPDQQAAPAADAFALKHREVYSEGEFLNRTVGFKAGYQFYRDPTGLFIGHWIGAASVWWSWNPDARVSFMLGQVPDMTYEGLNAQDTTTLNNNFNHDIFVGGPRLDMKLGDNVVFAGSVHGLYDAHIIGMTRWFVAPTMQIDVKSGIASGFVGAVAQIGKWEQAGLGGQDQNIFAWAAQAHGEVTLQPFNLALNALALSPDDQSEGNSRNGAFAYSSKSRSATIILTEDELRNWYDQLDRRMGRYEGGFWTHRAGLMVGDLKATWMVTKVFRPALVVGAASVLNKKNAMGNAFVGVETNLNLEFRVSENLAANLVGAVLVPGGAGGALLNRINLASTDPIWMAEASLLARY